MTGKKQLAVVLILLLQCLVASASDTVPSPPRPLGNLIDVGGYRVHLYCTGAGSPTVIVVGGGFSFDWGLIQPEVSKFSRVCTYDPSGTAWSDPFNSGENPRPGCIDRVNEIHRLLQKASIQGPYVLVGFSIGGLIGRLYTERYPNDVAAMVIVDHAFIDVSSDAPAAPPVPSKPPEAKVPEVATAAGTRPVLIFSTPIALGVEDDQNFKELSKRDQDLHVWAMSQSPSRPTAELANECSTILESNTGTQVFPLGDRPLIVIRTDNDLPRYGQLQKKLLGLSRDSKSVFARNSSHMVIVDEPELVVIAIREVVEVLRNGKTLNSGTLKN